MPFLLTFHILWVYMWHTIDCIFYLGQKKIGVVQVTRPILIFSPEPLTLRFFIVFFLRKYQYWLNEYKWVRNVFEASIDVKSQAYLILV